MRDSKSLSRGVLCVFGSHTFVPFWWMCKKQTAVSHSNAESENIRQTHVYVWVDYQLFSLVNVSWKHYPVSKSRGTLSVTLAKKSFCLIHMLTNVFFESIDDSAPPNNPNNSHSTQLCQKEDNAAVIQMINEGRSPNLEHVTRTR